MAPSGDPWREAGGDSRAEVREIFARHAPPEGHPKEVERHDPLPNPLLLPLRGWRALSPRGRVWAGAAGVAGLVALAVAWPQVRREAREGEQARSRQMEASLAAGRRELVEDQRPRRALLPARTRVRVEAAGGLPSEAGAVLAGEHLALEVGRDVRSRVRAGLLKGPLLGTTCTPKRGRSDSGASYTCMALTNRHRVMEREYTSGYRFLARLELPAGTPVRCKENPRPLHPTSHVITAPIARVCK